MRKRDRRAARAAGVNERLRRPAVVVGSHPWPLAPISKVPVEKVGQPEEGHAPQSAK